jgi:putative ABC transport system permease protein
VTTPLLTDIRNAARGLMRAPTVALSAILCLALGIGATAAISSAISRALLRQLPFVEPDRLVAVHRTTPTSGPQGTWPQSVPNFVDLSQQLRQIQQLSALYTASALVALPGGGLQVPQVYVTGELFRALGVRAARGRLLLPEDTRPDAPSVAVVSDEFWRSKLGADPAVVGTVISLDGTPTTIVGITLPEFRVPQGGNIFRADIWSPARFTPQQLGQRRSNFLTLLGRLAPGATVQAAHAEMQTVFAAIAAANPQLQGEHMRVGPLQAEGLQTLRKPLMLLFVAVCAVLLIAATNVAALLLARGVHRRREMAVRLALGARRWEVMRPSLAESGVIAALGVAAGMALAFGGVKTIGALAAARLPQLTGLTVDGRVIAFSLVLAVIVALVCGIAPAWQSTRVDPQDALRGGRGGGTGQAHHRSLGLLVVLEISLSLVLLIGAGLVLKGFAGLMRTDPGFETQHVLTFRLTVSAAQYPNQTSVQKFLEPALAAVRGVPGVEAAASINVMPYVNWGWNSNIRYEGTPKDNPTNYPVVEQRAATPELIDVTKQRLIAGRFLTASDNEAPATPQVVVVNQALVDRDFKGGTDVVGQRFHTSDTTFATIVGVVSNIQNVGPYSPPAPEMYYPYRQGALGTSNFPIMVRVRGSDPLAVVASIRAAVRTIDPSAAMSAERGMPEVIARSLGTPKFYFVLLGTFAAVAIVLAVAGLYGVLSYAVAQRTREIGIRAALGSPRSALMRLVTADGLKLVALGLIAGSAGAAGVTRFMTFMMYGVSPLDPIAWLASAAVMLVAALLAILLPARRAARVDPLIAIGSE